MGKSWYDLPALSEERQTLLFYSRLLYSAEKLSSV